MTRGSAGRAPRPDEPGAVRPGEELDATRLAGFLAGAVPGCERIAAAEVSVAQFGGGFSNLTYLVRIAGAPVDVAELVLRRPPFGVRRGVGSGFAHDVLREYRLLAALRPPAGPAPYPRVPRPVAACDDDAVLGAPFYLMERVPGVILRGRPGDPVLPPATLRTLSERFAAELAALHAVDWRAAGLGELGRPAGYVGRQVAGWTTRWHAARTSHVPAVEAAAEWLATHQPPEPADARGAALLHNDFKYDNFVLDPSDLTRVVAVLDWEMATVGAPLMDLGTSLAYWLEADDPPVLRGLGLGLTAAPGNMTRAELVEAYGRATGRDVSDALFYFVYGVFKLAVVAQQIYARYAAGHTRDPRFARLDAAVAALGDLAGRAVTAGRIDRLG